MEIVQERLEREFNLALIATSPSVVYKVTTDDGMVHDVDNPAHLPADTIDRAYRGAVCRGYRHRADRLCRHGDGTVHATGAASSARWSIRRRAA